MTSSSELSAGELTEALLRGASGLSSSEAAIRLLVEHGVWPARLAAAEFITLSDEDDSDEPRYAWVGWTDVVAALDAGPLTGGSGSENRVLRVAASLSGLGVPVGLSDTVTGLDRDNLALVLAAIFHANGSHQHKDDAAERAAGGVPRVIRPGTPMVELGPVVGSPAVVVATGAHQ
jgi:hypothetical protein